MYKKCAYHDKYFPNEYSWFPCTSEYFYINKKNSKDGLHPECKKCSIRKQQNDESYERMKEYARKDYENKPDYYKGKAHRNYRKNPEIYQESYKQWRNRNKDRLVEYRIKRSLHKYHDITEQEWMECKKFFNNRCAYCGMHIEDHYAKYAGELKKYDFSKDHAYNNGANDITNCIPSCKVCNSLKNSLDWDEWYTPDNPLYNERRFTKITTWLDKFSKEENAI